MNSTERIIEQGTLDENGDTLFIISPKGMLLIDAPFNVDAGLFGQNVSVVGRMGIPHSAPGITKLLADRIVGKGAIARRAFGIFQSGGGGSQDENWFRAERELLGI
jgi:hypothetical protein